MLDIFLYLVFISPSIAMAVLLRNQKLVGYYLLLIFFLFALTSSFFGFLASIFAMLCNIFALKLTGNILSIKKFFNRKND